jgi:hypothetical protein
MFLERRRNRAHGVGIDQDGCRRRERRLRRRLCAAAVVNAAKNRHTLVSVGVAEASKVSGVREDSESVTLGIEIGTPWSLALPPAQLHNRVPLDIRKGLSESDHDIHQELASRSFELTV